MSVRIAALIVAAGRGARAGGEMPKQYAPLAGQPVLAHSLSVFAEHPGISIVQTVIGPDDDALYASAAGASGAAVEKLLPPVHGGASRQESVLAGLRALAPSAPDVVLIHDGARSLVSPGLLDRVIAGVAASSGAIPALPIIDTLKLATEVGEAGDTVDRDGLYRVQTPQGFPFAAILGAHETAAATGTVGLTDDAAVAANAGVAVKFVVGEEDNMKITFEGDIERAARILNGRAPALLPRTGLGVDVHAFAPGNAVTLCGVEIPFERALKGHSDADVALHALTDAIYGALADGDIGSHFPPSDPKWKDADSAQFLTHAVSRARERGGRIVHVDVTIICEAPKVGPHRQAMTSRLAELLHIPTGAISVKATTTERLGFTGRSEGIAAQAVATVLLPDEGTAHE